MPKAKKTRKGPHASEDDCTLPVCLSLFVYGSHVLHTWVRSPPGACKSSHVHRPDPPTVQRGRPLKRGRYLKEDGL